MDYKKKKFLEHLNGTSSKEFKAFIDNLSAIRDLIAYYPFESDPTYSKHGFITDYLKGFGFSFAQDGIYYLRTSLGYLLYETNDRIAFTKLARIVSKRHHVSDDTVIRGTFHSINTAYTKNFQLFDCFNHPWHAPSANEFIYRFLYYAQDVQYMLNHLLNTEPDTSKVFSYSAISNYLSSYALPTDQIGYRYIREALHIMLANSCDKIFSLPEIIRNLADRFETTTDAIKASMRRCVRAAYEECPEYFAKFEISENHPLHYQFIANAANELGLLTCSY